MDFLLKILDFLKSLRIKELAADLAYSVKSFAQSSPRKVMLIAAAVLIALILIVKALVGPEAAVVKTVTAKVPEKKDQAGSVWKLELMKGQAGRRFDADGPGPGEPLVIKPKAQMQRGMVNVGVQLLGQAGEKYVPGVMKDGKWLDPPKYTVVSEKGKVLASGKFEYG